MEKISQRSSLDLPGHQLDLLKAVYATGKPTILVVISGRPNSINWADKHIPAILEAWYPGFARWNGYSRCDLW